MKNQYKKLLTSLLKIDNVDWKVPDIDLLTFCNKLKH